MAPADPHKVGTSGSIPGPATDDPVVQRQRPPAYTRATMVRVHPGSFETRNSELGTRNARMEFRSAFPVPSSALELGISVTAALVFWEHAAAVQLCHPQLIDVRPHADVARPQQGACLVSRIMRVRPPPSALSSAEFGVRNAEFRKES